MTSAYHFDNSPDRRGTDSVKWGILDADILPLWVADMDFASPPAVVEALHRRVEHAVFGYAFDLPELREVLVARMAQRYGWQIGARQMTYFPGIVSALYTLVRITGSSGDGVLVQTPVYGPFLSATTGNGRELHVNELVAVTSGQDLRYEIDFDAFEAAVQPHTRMFILCNPHNPVGRAFTRAELERMAEICLRHNLLIVSDEIHSDLLLGDTQHIPIASLSPEVADQTVTLIAPSKTFNMPGLSCSVVIAQNADTLKRLSEAGMAAGHVPSLGLVAALAAYRDGGDWLDALLVYLKDNRDTLVNFVKTHLPGIGVTTPEATYLGWLDCKNVPVLAPDEKEHPMFALLQRFFLTKARVALNDGAWFGQGGAGFARINFGTSRAVLLDALERIRAALAAGA